jgi:hypothetical protein
VRLVPDDRDRLRTERGHGAERIAKLGIGLQLLRVGDLELRHDRVTQDLRGLARANS